MDFCRARQRVVRRESGVTDLGTQMEQFFAQNLLEFILDPNFNQTSLKRNSRCFGLHVTHLYYVFNIYQKCV